MKLHHRYNEIMRKKEIWLILFILLMTVVIGCTETKEQSPVKIAIIDTGISTRAIPSEAILEGKNYVNPELDTEDTYGHGTAVASIILENAPEVKLVPLISNVCENVTIKTLSGNTKTGDGTSYFAAKVTAEKAKELKK